MEADGGPARVRPGLAQAFVVLGAAAAAAGSFLDWFRIRVSVRGLGLVARTVTSKGIDGSDGKITLIAGLVAVLMGLLMFVWTSGSRRVATGVVALLAGLTAAGLSAFDAATPQQRFIDANAPDLAGRTRIPLTTAKKLYEGLLRSGTVRISLALGIFVVIAGGAVAALAAAFALGKSPEEPVTDAAPERMAAQPEQTA
jgi:hypothetical protein